MDYKKIIKNRNIRLKILSLLNWIPDKQMIMLQYFIKTGRWPNLDKPIRYTEKLQFYKLYYRKNLLAECADKLAVRKYVKSKGLDCILNELYSVYDKVTDIDFNKLPNSFVLKKTNGGGGNDVIICTDKKSININGIMEKMSGWTRIESNGAGREWVYYIIKPKIIAEKYIDAKNSDLIDYKFFCFNGKPCYLYVINGRKLGEEVNLGIFDMDFNQLPYFRKDEKRMISFHKIPKNFEDMKLIASKLSEDFPHVRVDLYNNDGEIIFGELTFFDGSGYQMYEPDEFDFILGNKFTLPSI